MSDLFREYPKPEFVLPEKWCIKSENAEQHLEIVNYFEQISESNSVVSLYAWQYHGYFYFHKPFYSSRCALEFKLDEYTKLTFEQFEKYILKKENMRMKKLIGYKIIKPQYIKASEIITNFPGLFDERKESSLPAQGIHFTAGSACAMSLRAAGVLDLWFEPVYEEEIVVLSLGSPEKTNIKISKGKIVVEGTNEIALNQLHAIYQGLDRICCNELIGTEKRYPMQILKTVKIGCTTFTQEEVKKVLDTYDSLK